MPRALRLTSALGVVVAVCVSVTAASLALVPQAAALSGEVVGEVAGEPAVVIADRGPLEDEGFAWYSLTGFTTVDAYVAQCALPVGADLTTSSCSPAVYVSLDETGSLASAGLWVTAHLRASGDGTTVDCRAEACAIVGFTADGDAVASAPLRFRQPLALALSPSSGLMDGQAMEVTVAGLGVGASVRLARCTPGTEDAAVRCEMSSTTAAVADGTGTIRAEVAASQRLTNAAGHRYCRVQCTIAAVAADGTVVVESPYRMKAGTVSVSPSNGLTGREPVTITATDLQPSYDGPVFMFPTGQWAVVQCDAGLVGSRSIGDVFGRCAVPTGGGRVGVRSAVTSTTITPSRSIAKILGGITDCTAEPGACVVGLVRWEQDGSVTTAVAPISFA